VEPVAPFSIQKCNDFKVIFHSSFKSLVLSPSNKCGTHLLQILETTLLYAFNSTLQTDTIINSFQDLVKSHLMFAVREEVDSLRSRIMELETTVVHLEAENSILREHVPNNILQSLSLQPKNHQSSITTA
jgi:hypothetical protein